MIGHLSYILCSMRYASQNTQSKPTSVCRTNNDREVRYLDNRALTLLLYARPIYSCHINNYYLSQQPQFMAHMHSQLTSLRISKSSTSGIDFDYEISLEKSKKSQKLSKLSKTLPNSSNSPLRLRCSVRSVRIQPCYSKGINHQKTP